MSNQRELFQRMCAIFLEPKALVNDSLVFFCNIWWAAEILLTICKGLTKMDETFLKGSVLTFIIWIVIYLHLAPSELEKV